MKYLSVVLALLVVCVLALTPTSRAVAAPEQSRGGIAPPPETPSCEPHYGVWMEPSALTPPNAFSFSNNPHLLGYPEYDGQPCPLASAPIIYVVGATLNYMTVPFGNCYMFPSMDFVGTATTNAAADVKVNFYVNTGIFTSDAFIYIQFWQDAQPGPGSEWQGSSYNALFVNV